jgi:hypothetical protein
MKWRRKPSSPEHGLRFLLVPGEPGHYFLSRVRGAPDPGAARGPTRGDEYLVAAGGTTRRWKL